MDHGASGWGKEVFALTGKQGVDIAFEHVGAATFAHSLRALRRGGRLVTCGATTGSEVGLDLRPMFFKNLSVLGNTMGSRGTVHRILKLAGEGRLKPVVDRVLPLAQVAEAHRLMDERAHFGKIVLEP